MNTTTSPVTICAGFEISFVPLPEFDKRNRDKQVATEIADIWMARQGYEAMMLNERGVFDESVNVFDREDQEFTNMIDDLEEVRIMLRRRAGRN